MGLIEILHDKTVYLDANIFIYAVEHSDIYKPILDSLFEQIDEGNIYALTSTLTLAEPPPPAPSLIKEGAGGWL